MTADKEGHYSPETRAIHAADAGNDHPGVTPPICQTSTFKLPHAGSGAEYSTTVAPEHFYTRWGNPTIKLCEKAVADLEGAEAALALSSGMGAISTLFLTLLKAGDHVVVGSSIYSGVRELNRAFLSRFGIESSFVDASSLEALEQALRPETRLIFVETPTNPTLELCDLRALAGLGQRRSVLTAVDGTFATPVNQRPLALGIDFVVHAATKGLGGHSDLTAGVICGPGDWIAKAWQGLKVLGACLSPFEAWLLLRGIKTLFVRVRQQSATSLAVASFLENHPGVERVYYPGLKSHPQHDLATRQMEGFGSVVSFEPAGGHEASVRIAESLKLFELAVSLGGVESLISLPASMTHGMLPRDEIDEAGIAAGLLRLSIGLEDVDDLIADLDQALGAGPC